MMKKNFWIACALMLCIAALAGCSGAQTSSGAQQTREPAAAAEMEVTAEPEVTTEPAAETALVSPLPVTMDVEQLDNCTAAVSLREGDVYVDDTGVLRMKVTVYTYDLYDMVDIARLKAGDRIVIGQQEVQVTSVERNDFGTVLINGGLDVGGYELYSDDNTVYYECGYSDVKSYYELGEAVLRVSPDFQYTDSSDLDKDAVTYYPGDFLTESAGIQYGFTPHNTSIVIEDGAVIAMRRVYTP